jgi:hypothetical protein
MSFTVFTGWALTNWYFTLPAVLITPLIYIYIHDEMKEREQAYVQQQAYRLQLAELDHLVLATLESLPNHLASAEDRLDQALIYFKDRAFAPFWDSVEATVDLLARFHEGVRQIQHIASKRIEISKRCSDAPPSFPLTGDAANKLAVGAVTTDRAVTIIRQAQRDFQFASILEQRMTNKHLLAGFRNLTHQITNLSSSIDSMGERIQASVDRVQQSSEAHYRGAQRASSEDAARQERAIAMLDNIQRRRRPGP